MLVTALSPVIGYDKAAEIAHQAATPVAPCARRRWRSGTSAPTEFDRVIDPASMVGAL